MKLDAFIHVLPAAYAHRMSELADTPAARNIRQRISGASAVVDVDLRLRQLEEFGEGYRQIISLPAPPLEPFSEAHLSPRP
jgi:aminocarboxymuconate-semialdehyde decarboxylase